MSHSPPVPEASRSPYPLTEPPHDSTDTPPDLSVSPLPETRPSLPIGMIGAVIGLGAVAFGGAILGLRLWGTKSKPRRQVRRKG